MKLRLLQAFLNAKTIFQEDQNKIPKTFCYNHVNTPGENILKIVAA